MSSSEVNPGFAAKQLERVSLADGVDKRVIGDGKEAERQQQKAKKMAAWINVYAQMCAGALKVGSRTPYSDWPAWVTLEVLYGGFASGKALAALDQTSNGKNNEKHKKQKNTAVEHSANAPWLSDDGAIRLSQLLDNSCYRIGLPEHGALLAIAWLQRNHHEEDAAAIFEQCVRPYAGALRFFPDEAEQPYDTARRCATALSTVADVQRSLEMRATSSLSPYTVRTRNYLAQALHDAFLHPFKRDAVALFANSVGRDGDGWPLCHAALADAHWQAAARALKERFDAFADALRRNALAWLRSECGEFGRRRSQYGYSHGNSAAAAGNRCKKGAVKRGGKRGAAAGNDGGALSDAWWLSAAEVQEYCGRKEMKTRFLSLVRLNKQKLRADTPLRAMVRALYALCDGNEAKGSGQLWSSKAVAARDVGLIKMAVDIHAAAESSTTATAITTDASSPPLKPPQALSIDVVLARLHNYPADEGLEADAVADVLRDEITASEWSAAVQRQRTDDTIVDGALKVFLLRCVELSGEVETAAATATAAAAPSNDTAAAPVTLSQYAPLSRAVRRAQSLPIEELLRDGHVKSAESLALLAPPLIAASASRGVADRELRHLLFALRVAFLRRRSLLLLNYGHQVTFEELPWVAPLLRHAAGSESAAASARQAMRALLKMALVHFAHTPLPNKLLRIFDLLRGQAALEDVHITEELAADIFMGDFTTKFGAAARQAAAALQGTAYERYFVLRGDWDAVQRGDDTFGAVAARRGGGRGGRSVGRNGRIIEAAMCMTSHNVVTLVAALQPRVDFASCAAAALSYVLWQTEAIWFGAESSFREARRRCKRVAFAARQLLLFVSLGALDGAAWRALCATAMQRRPRNATVRGLVSKHIVKVIAAGVDGEEDANYGALVGWVPFGDEEPALWKELFQLKTASG